MQFMHLGKIMSPVFGVDRFQFSSVSGSKKVGVR